MLNIDNLTGWTGARNDSRCFHRTDLFKRNCVNANNVQLLSLLIRRVLCKMNNLFILCNELLFIYNYLYIKQTQF